MDDGQASTQPEFLTAYRRQRAQMPVGEPDKDECPVDTHPGERPSQEGLGRYASDAGTAKRSGAAQAGRRARENARRRS